MIPVGEGGSREEGFHSVPLLEESTVLISIKWGLRVLTVFLGMMEIKQGIVIIRVWYRVSSQ